MVQFEYPRHWNPSVSSKLEVARISLFPLLALWGNKNWLPSMKVRKFEIVQNKMGWKGCTWSSLNTPGTETPLSHRNLKLEEFPFLIISPNLRGSVKQPTKLEPTIWRRRSADPQDWRFRGLLWCLLHSKLLHFRFRSSHSSLFRVITPDSVLDIPKLDAEHLCHDGLPAERQEAPRPARVQAGYKPIDGPQRNRYVRSTEICNKVSRGGGQF